MRKILLRSNLHHMKEDYPPDDLDTSSEEQHVLDFLWESSSWVSRKSINESLKRNFPRMQTPFWRTKVFINGHRKKKFWVAKGPYGQTVGLTEEDAFASLSIMTDSIKKEEAENFTPDLSVEDEQGGQDPGDSGDPFLEMIDTDIA
jgi:hypothetical protein